MLLKSIDKASRDHYIIQTVFDWTERISAPEFRRAWEHVAANHEILRSTFRWKNTDEPFQEITPEVGFDFETLTFSEYGPEEKAASLRHFLEEDLKRGFALDGGPPWRVSILSFGDGTQTAVWTFHHVLLDGRSHVFLLRELLAAYEALLENRVPEVVRETPQRLHVQWLKEQDFSPSQEFWKSYLNPEKVATELPKPAEPHSSLAGHVTFRLGLGQELTDRINQFAKTEGVSAGNVIQAAWALVLGWLANENDVTFGAVRACRKSGLPDGENVVGVVINTLPLRVCWTPQSSLRSVAAGVAKDWRRFRNVEHTPLQAIGKWIGLPTNRELFATAVSFSSEYFEHAVLGESPKRPQRKLWLQQTTPFCAVDASFDGSQFHLTTAFPRNSVLPSIADRLPAYLKNTIAAIVHRPEAAVSELSPLDPDERRQVVAGFNQHWEPPPETIDWLERIASHSASRPEQLAVKAPDGELCRQTLEDRSHELARFLAEHGVAKGDLAAVFLPRSAEYVEVCLGILKSGAAYLPIDPNWPVQRILDILRDANVKGVITSAVLAPALTNYEGSVWLTTETLSENGSAALSIPPIAPDDLAYIIYTSGSTGTPKGVEVTHRGLQNLIDDTIAEFGLTDADRGSSVSNPAFDASVHEVWPVLAAGASIHIPDSGMLADPRKLLDWLEQFRISFSFLSTAMAEAVLQLCDGRRLALRYLLTGGDQLRVIPKHSLPFQLVNEYGPTESTVIGTRYRISPDLDSQRNIPIGRAIRGTRAYVVNQANQLLPPGVPGELLLAGNGLARGYRNRPELTAAKFIENVVAEEPGRRLYRTGDLVRWSDDGHLQFLGRIDGQIKLRGFRIELGEIEACALRHPSVAEAVAVLQTGTAPRIAAFIVPKEGIEAAEVSADLKAFVRKLLPSYMVPSSIVLRDRLPVNSSGKYDRQALLNTGLPTDQTDRRATKPTWSETERQIVEIWKETLGVPEVQLTDRFLELGATSLSIIKLLCAVELRFGKTLSATDILNDPTPHELAGILEGDRREPSSCIVTLKGSGSKAPIFVIPGAGGGVHWFRRMADALEPDRPMLGLELLGLPADVQEHFTVPRAARELAKIVATLPGAEPFILCGYSGGGLIALELASQLAEQGKTVGSVILLETHRSEIMPGGLAKTARWIQGWLSLPAHKKRAALLSRARFYSSALAGEPEVLQPQAEQLQVLKNRHMEAFASHKVRRYDGKVAVISAEDRPLSTYSDPAREWSDALSSLEVVRVEGDHYTMLGPQHAGKLASVMCDLADRFSSQNFRGQDSLLLQAS